MTNSELKKSWKKVLEISPSDKISKVKIDQWYKPLGPVRIDEAAGVIYFVSDDSRPRFSAGSTSLS